MKCVALKNLLWMAVMTAFMVYSPVDVVAFDDPPQEEEKMTFPFEDEVLLGFFDSNREISALQRETQARIDSTLTQYNLTSERFGQIGRAAQIGALSGGTFSNEEIESFNSVAPLVTAIQREQQAMMQALLAEKGLTTQLYQEIINQFRQSRDLQAYVQELARERAVEQVREERRKQRELEAAEAENNEGTNGPF
jgi:hypothetical protein